MPTNSDVGINLKARTDEFEAKLKKAVGVFESLAIKGNDVSRSVNSSFKKMGVVAKNSVNDIERAFNSLSIKSDFSLSNQTKALALNAKFFERQYKAIAADANSSASEVTRAFTAMNSKIRQLNEQPLKSAFSTLGILPTSAVEANKAKIVSAFNEIKNSGTASAKDIKQAHSAMNRELLRTEGQVSKTTKKFDVMSLASVASIAKIQVLFSLINTSMSLIARIPATMMASVEDFNAAAVANAAIITSIQRSTRDVGERYKENKIFAEGVQKVLIEMDAQTSASGENLTDMNRKFTEQGILLDANNDKQKQGMLAVANAIAALNSGSANIALQFSQETSSMLEGTIKAGNKLASFLDGQMQGALKENLALWKQQSIEQNNSGLILEKLLPFLLGFQEAQKDINKLWSTTKSTLDTIYKEILRDGFAPQFEIIVKKTQEFGDVLTKNKDKLAEMMRAGFSGGNEVLKFLAKYSADLVLVGGILVTAKAAQFAFNVVVKANPYILAAGALVILNKELGIFKVTGSDVIKIADNFGQSLKGLVAVARGEITPFQFATANAKELEILLTKRGRILTEIKALEDSLVPKKGFFNFTLFKDPNADKRHAKEISDQIIALKRELEALPLIVPDPASVAPGPAAGVPGEILGGAGGVSEADQAKIDKAIADGEALAIQWKKTRIELEREINQSGLNDFEISVDNINNKAADLIAEFGNLSTIEVWKKNEIGALKAADAAEKVKVIVKQLADEQRDINKLTEDFEAVVLSTLPQQEQAIAAITREYAKRRAIVSAAVAEGLAGNEAEAISLRLVRQEAAEVNKVYAEMKEGGIITASILTDAFTQWGNGLSSTLTDAVFTAELSFGAILESFAKMLTQMVIQTLIVQPLISSITGFFSQGGVVAPALASPGIAFDGSNANGNAFSGISGHSNTIVSSPTLFKHAGAMPFANGAGLMGEAGPEAIMPLSRDASGKLGVSGGGGKSVTNVIINNNATKSEVSSTEITNASGGKDIMIMIEDIVGNSIRSGRGNISKALRSTFGATPMLAGR